MNKTDFLEQLEARLKGINIVDRVRSLDYFSEMLDDSIEDGMSEDEAVAALGSIEGIAQRIIEESQTSAIRYEKFFEHAKKPDSASDLDDKFSSIRVRVRESDVRILRSDDGESRVDCVDSQWLYHRVFTKDGELNIELVDERRWFDRLKHFSSTLKVTIYLPESIYDALYVETMSGDIEMQHCFTFNNVRIKAMSGDIESSDINCNSGSFKSVSGNIKLKSILCDNELIAASTSGDIILSDINCKNGSFSSVSGDAKLTNALCSNKFKISSTSGDVRFESCDGISVELKSVSGDIKGSLLSSKQFCANSFSGSMSLPQNTPCANGKCLAQTVSGSIHLSLCE